MLSITIRRILVRCAIAAFLMTVGVHWLAGAADDVSNPNLHGPSYGEQVAQRHDCWTSGRQELPSAAVVTFHDDIAPRYTTDPHEVDLAFRAALGEDVPSVYSVTALCRK